MLTALFPTYFKFSPVRAYCNPFLLRIPNFLDKSSAGCISQSSLFLQSHNLHSVTHPNISIMENNYLSYINGFNYISYKIKCERHTKI